MARPLRIEFPGAIYHVTSRGDRAALLAVLALGLRRFDAQVPPYCLMDNHYHFVLQTRAGNLSQLMRHINGIYTQSFNRRHSRVGHLFQGRFKAILVDRDAYLLELCRYAELNPVRAEMVASAGDWAWSSYQAHVGCAAAPAWLDTPGLHAYLLGAEPRDAGDRLKATQGYVDWVAAGQGADLWAGGLNRQVFLGDDDFVRRMQDQAELSAMQSRSIPKAHRSRPKTLKQWLRSCASREEALRCGYVNSGITMTAMAAELGLTVARVSQLIARAEAKLAHPAAEEKIDE